MIKDKPFIEKLIELRKNKNDMIKAFCIRNKDSPREMWGGFIPYNPHLLNYYYHCDIDGIKLKFKCVIIKINARL